MAQYRVTAKSFIGNSIREEGDIVEYDGLPGPNLEPLDAAGEKASKTAAKASAADVRRQRAAAATGDPENASSPLFTGEPQKADSADAPLA